MSDKLNLQREKSGETGTFGTCYDDDDNKIFVTCERPPTGDHPCIPPGKYRFSRFTSPHNGDCFLCDNPPAGRDMIEIHSANTMVQLLGCIAPGQDIGKFTGVHDGQVYDLPGVTNSRSTLKMLLMKYPNGFDLEIVNPPPEGADA